MNEAETLSAPAQAWADALQALAIFALDPAGTGGVSLRAPAGWAREKWLALLAAALPAGTKLRRMPANIADEALLGGIDLGATLREGRKVASAGLLAGADGGIVIAAMAERLPAGTAARLTAVLDTGRLALVALDEGIDEEERPAPALLDRMAFHLDLSAVSHRDIDGTLPTPDCLASARAALPSIVIPAEVLEAICGTCLALGIDSARAPLLALTVSRAAAALAGRDTATMEDAALAARLVLSARATRLPAAEPPPDADSPDHGDEQPGAGDNTDTSAAPPEPGDQAATDLLLDAAKAAIPAGLLTRLQSQDFRPGRPTSQGQAGAKQKGAQRGRPAGVRAAAPGNGLRLNLIETVRAAAPWQRLRAAGETGSPPGRVRIRREDFRVTRTEQRARTTTIFLVDASGSAALARLAEAKGAVELLLADCYRRRDQVAVVAFRGRGAQLLLPPTRSLVRAKRSLAGLPGGGGTPMAAGIDAGFLLAEAARRGGFTPTLVLLTDGRANVTSSGAGGRAQAQLEATDSARRVRAAGFSALVLDTSPRPGPEASQLAQALGALYVPLPYANAAAVSAAVRHAGNPA